MTTQSRRARTRRVAFDVVAGLNAIGLLISEFTALPSGQGFRLLSLSLLAVYVIAWIVLRHYEFPLWATVAFELAVLGHLAGRFVVIGDLNLYRVVLVDIPMDKAVHAFNSAAAAVFVTALFDSADLALGRWSAFVVVMVVSGLGALVEIIEYVGALLLPTTYVGGYANNMQDLVANLLGSMVGWAIASALLARERVDGRAFDTQA